VLVLYNNIGLTIKGGDLMPGTNNELIMPPTYDPYYPVTPEVPTGVTIITNIITLALVAVMVASYFKIFQKMGRKGWESLIPFYNYYVLLKVLNKPSYWLVLFLIPFVGSIFMIILLNDMVKAFGRSSGFTVGLIFLPFIFFPLLAFKKEYVFSSGVTNSPSVEQDIPTFTPQPQV
jgi:hypothetical protein